MSHQYETFEPRTTMPATSHKTPSIRYIFSPLSLFLSLFHRFFRWICSGRLFQHTFGRNLNSYCVCQQLNSHCETQTVDKTIKCENPKTKSKKKKTTERWTQSERNNLTVQKWNWNDSDDVKKEEEKKCQKRNWNELNRFFFFSFFDSWLNPYESVLHSTPHSVHIYERKGYKIGF